MEKQRNYFRQVQEELKKVSWTSKQELLLSTKIVVIATFVCGIGIYFADIIIRMILNGVSMLTI